MIAKQRAPCLQGEIEHHVAKKDEVKAFLERKGRAYIGLTKVAESGNFRLDDPVVADMVEIANQQAGRQPAIHFDAVISTLPGAPDQLQSRYRCLRCEYSSPTGVENARE